MDDTGGRGGGDRARGGGKGQVSGQGGMGHSTGVEGGTCHVLV